MQTSMIARWSGYVRIRCQTSDVAQFLELMKLAGWPVWQVLFVDETCVALNIRFRHFLQLRPIARASQTRIAIMHKKGWPMLWKRAHRHKLFFLGLFVATVLIYLLFSLVWRIEVVGNKRIADEVVLQAASQLGLKRFTWRDRVADPTTLGKQLQRRIGGVAWVGVEVRGVVISLRIVEADVAEAKPPFQGHHVVARKAAVISHLFAERGKALVTQYQRVKKGDVLISGWIGTEEHHQLIAARGTVKGLVWYDISMKIPLRHHVRTMTGHTYTRRFAFIGAKAIQFSGFVAPPFAHHITYTHLFPWRVAGWRLPLGEMRETLWQVEEKLLRRTPTEAKRQAIEMARLHFLRNLSQARTNEVIIRKQQTILQKQTASDLHLRVFFEVEESIAEYVDNSSIQQPQTE